MYIYISLCIIYICMYIYIYIYIFIYIKQYDKRRNKLNKQIKYGTIQKVCHLYNSIFHPIQLFFTLCQFYSNTFPVLFTKPQ